MTDNAKEASQARPDSDNRFLAECFLATDPSMGKIDLSIVAAAMGHSNEASTSNKLGQLRKKYGFDIKCFHSSTQKGKESGTDSETTPTKATPKPNSRKKKTAKTPEKDAEVENEPEVQTEEV